MTQHGDMKREAIPGSLAAVVIDHAPRWIWKPANLRMVGTHTLHFCFGHEGRRTVEWDGREVAVGHRNWVPLGNLPPE
jgi:hypothetical protein